MVKVLTYGGKDLKSVQRHLAYLNRKGELEIETDEGERMTGKGVEKELLEDWDYRQHWKLRGYARALGTTEAALRRACHLVAGQSPSALLHSRMLIEAERQLRYTGMRVTEIAYFLGFEDPAYFSRFFAKRMGFSPNAYRRRRAVS